MGNAGARILPALGIAASIGGIIITVFFYFMVGGLLDSMHEISVGQVDNAVAIMVDAKGISTSAGESVNTYSAFMANASYSVSESSEALALVSDAVDSLAGGIGAIPYMPSDAVNPLYDAAAEIDAVAVSLEQTSGSMEETGEGMMSTSLGIDALNEDIGLAISNLQKTKSELDAIYGTASLGLFLGTILLIIMFSLNGAGFYQKLNE